MSQRDSRKEGGGRKGVFFFGQDQKLILKFFARKNILDTVGANFLKLGSRFLQRKTKVYQGIE